MSAAAARVATLLAAVHRRVRLRLLGLVVPVLALIAVLVLRLGGMALLDAALLQGLLVIGLVVAVLVLAWQLVRLRRRYSTHWLLARLDLQVPALEDSSALAVQTTPARGLSGLQQARIAQRLATLPLPDQRPPLHGRGMALLWLLAFAAAALLLRWPVTINPPAAPAVIPATAQAAAGLGQTTIASMQLQITPPAYTGAAAQTQSTLDVRAPEGSRLNWTLRFDPAPQSAALQFVDGRRLQMQRAADGAFSASAQLLQPTLYRLAVDASAPPLPDRTLHTLAPIADAPPLLRVLAPTLSLTRHDPAQARWALELEASDDYGLGTAELVLTRTQGSGEQVRVSEERIALGGRGDRRQRRYAHTVDLAALGFAEGDDLIARFVVSDQRQPKAQTTRSPSFILRWPAPPIGEASGVDGLVNTTLPAYFRSQRQIIIDTEALIALRPRPAADDFGVRSDTIGVDQRVLRLRYGQFLGEEFEPPEPPPGLAEPSHGETDDGHAEAGHDAHAHGAGDDSAASTFGDAGAVMADYGHTHDIAEAATLLDPATRKLLKSALDEMWQAELFLRTARPAAALPYEYRALEFIKQVQQASRIYLARVGLELPPIDFNRRMTGDRTGLRARSDPLVAAAVGDDVAAASWRALDEPAGSDGQRAALNALLAWLPQAPVAAEQRLALLAAADALQQDPACGECLGALRKQLWPLLQAPPATLEARSGPDRAGKAYLDALDAAQDPQP